MDPCEGGKTDATHPDDEEKRLFSLYGKLPDKKGLLRVKERKYFDSGDLALEQAGKTSDTGVTVRTGKDHPLLKNLSHLSSPVPGGSNVAKEAESSEASHHQAGSEGHDVSDSHLKEEEDVDTKQK
ncbi:hypothetical protein NA57DRAFT_80330 [Rhizodiscina lignyota]|uniref:mRNA stability protein n=1 Tax=Rhizodiscina lignyota TaxID=1504668 RepID=A0A9P4M2D6_9PEZI|nr:hypothetical protein NA57DRAFT_80330 [Rhizodiscina lignyota]